MNTYPMYDAALSRSARAQLRSVTEIAPKSNRSEFKSINFWLFAVGDQSVFSSCARKIFEAGAIPF